MWHPLRPKTPPRGVFNFTKVANEIMHPTWYPPIMMFLGDFYPLSYSIILRSLSEIG